MEILVYHTERQAGKDRMFFWEGTGREEVFLVDEKFENQKVGANKKMWRRPSPKSQKDVVL